MVVIQNFYLYLTALVTISQSRVNNAQLLPPLNPPPENTNSDFISLANRYGFQPLQHEVTTDDGYILTLFHIPGRSKYPVLFTHGLADAADLWLLRGENSLGVTLANEGYDVWFANSRGNRYSRRHVSLDPDNNATYWNFSFHEMGYYDLPAIIDRILNETQKPSVTAIGHSRGNLMFYILGATRPEYNSKVNVMISLEPICHLTNTKPPVMTILQAVPFIDQLFNSLNITITEFLGYNSTMTRLVRAYCTYPNIGNELCLNTIIFPLFGFDEKELEPSFVNVFIYHFPAGTSWMEVLHLSQLTRKDFSQFDYGTAQNVLVYNSSVPPAYNLTLATMPFALLAGRNDRLSTLPDVGVLRKQLPNVVDYTVNRRALFNHADAVLGRHMPDYLFPDIRRVLKRYNKRP
ncbi:lipase member J-like [Maniola jurtina]|uniref:lipase member J-like n=1 Tax=Maniola jurtina TaxID=191418 RepID=UPI001E687530|nr:lipase member J-like [Maniola jurtina]